MQEVRPKGEAVTALMEDPGAGRGSMVSRKEAARVLRQVMIGVGAILLAAVDDWNALAERHAAHLRTAMQPLGRGAYVAAAAAAGTDVWLNTHGMHPPNHLVSKPFRWPAISSHNKTYLTIHHNEMEPTNARRTAFCNQDSQTLGLVGDPTHCEMTWDYDALTDSHVVRIWVSAPGVGWERFEVPMGKVQSQLASWRKRGMKWLPGTLTATADVASLPVREVDERLQPGIEVAPPRRDEDGRQAE